MESHFWRSFFFRDPGGDDLVRAADPLTDQNTGPQNMGVPGPMRAETTENLQKKFAPVEAFMVDYTMMWFTVELARVLFLPMASEISKSPIGKPGSEKLVDENSWDFAMSLQDEKDI